MSSLTLEILEALRRSLGFMKAFIINCSTWTLLSKTRRREEQEAFAEFKQALVYYCR